MYEIGKGSQLKDFTGQQFAGGEKSSARTLQ